jgi:protein tyrosine/serine phosphatase
MEESALIRNVWMRWALGAALAAFITVVPYVYFRISYTYQKRFRVVTPGKMYRSGCMTAAGLEQAIKKHGIKTVINLMEEAPDPLLQPHFFAPASVKESELVARAGARYILMTVDYLPRNKARTQRPETIERYLEILDHPGNYPVLIHCKAGLHRTGVLVALYRMEYEDWTKSEALEELRVNGFGEFASTSANEYVQQYVLSYRPHQRPGRVVERMPAARGNLVSRPGAYAPLPKD